MKKLLSVILAMVLVLGLTTIAFGSSTSDRVKTAIMPLDTNGAADLSTVGPGKVAEYVLTADMFTWSSGVTGIKGGPITKAQMGSASITYTGNNTKVIESAKIEYKANERAGGKTTAVVVVKFINPFVSTTAQSFDINMFITIGSRQSLSRTILEGELKNEEKSISSGNFVTLKDGEVLVPTSTIRNLTVDIGGGVDINSNVFSGTKYYGTAKNEVTSADEKVIDRYASITDIIRVNTIGFTKTGKTVSLANYGSRWVYNESGQYLGKAAELVALSSVYYLSSTDLGASIATGNSGGSGSGSGSGSGNENNNGNGSGTGSGSGSGSGSGTGTGTTPSTSGTVGKADATTLANNAVAAAKTAGKKLAEIKVANKSTITIEALTEINRIAKAAGMSSVVYADTKDGNKFLSRLCIYPASAAKLTADIKIDSYINGDQVGKTTTKFNKYYKNKLVVMSMGQDNSFGMGVDVAAKVDISGLDKNNIYFYSYNRAANKYYRINNPKAWVDNQGFLRFTTTLAGDIIICEGALAKK